MRTTLAAFLLLTALPMLTCSCAPSGRFTYHPELGGAPLHQAAQYHDSAAVATQLAVPGSRVDLRDERGRTPLMLAAGAGDPDATQSMRLLIASGADVNARDDRGYTPMMHAATGFWEFSPHGITRPPESLVERMQILLVAGADPKATENSGRTVLMIAVSENRLLKGQTATFLAPHVSCIDARDPEGRTALMFAAADGPDNIAALVAAGADVNAQDAQGRTALMHAFGGWWAANGYAVKPLLAANAALEITDQNGWTALAHAAWNGRTLSPSKELLNAGARLQPLGWTQLHASALVRDPKAVRAELDKGADPNAQDRFGRTPLMWASRFIHGNDGVQQMLIQAGADPKTHDAQGATALHIAAAGASDGELSTLLSAGADVNAVDAQGDTPLISAARADSGKYNAQLLLAHGARVNAKNSAGQTALICATKNRRADLELVRMLIAAGADPLLPDASGRTARDYARERKNDYEGHWLVEALNGPPSRV